MPLRAAELRSRTNNPWNPYLRPIHHYRPLPPLFFIALSQGPSRTNLVFLRFFLWSAWSDRVFSCPEETFCNAAWMRERILSQFLQLYIMMLADRDVTPACFTANWHDAPRVQVKNYANWEAVISRAGWVLRALPFGGNLEAKPRLVVPGLVWQQKRSERLALSLAQPLLSTWNAHVRSDTGKNCFNSQRIFQPMRRPFLPAFGHDWSHSRLNCPLSGPGHSSQRQPRSA